ncbi:hypothetical protein [uncultured Pseudoteredinibacter sp.]|uniref:hypothetical protein n=1 Tax=uncultured Pseudoteredinibacter sp. TaxID=1641701 RepID=UPI0026162F8C|nr:hypothetical protein [uncultured Pseudoteredinibacter sp.]
MTEEDLNNYLPLYNRPLLTEIAEYLESHYSPDNYPNDPDHRVDQSLFEYTELQIEKAQNQESGLGGKLAQLFFNAPAWLSAYLLNANSQEAIISKIEDDISANEFKDIIETWGDDLKGLEVILHQGVLLTANSIIRLRDKENQLLASSPEVSYIDANSALQEYTHSISNAYTALRINRFTNALLLHQAKLKSTKSKGGSKSNKEPIFSLFIEWAFEHGSKLPIRYSSDAAKYFIENELKQTHPDYYRLVSTNTHRAMAKKLNEHCAKNDKANPITSKDPV